MDLRERASQLVGKDVRGPLSPRADGGARLSAGLKLSDVEKNEEILMESPSVIEVLDEPESPQKTTPIGLEVFLPLAMLDREVHSLFRVS